ncbi:VOC family protein [Amycolatopsis jiangsuensis]|uniref:Putative glyoxalase superfamily protein PhnB n=1 Tax=Amycolatopsis jiangsuensis TaxID=1181879 RepID=A0A840IVT1_9PSEU|nr:VOC family protein [Amycolatopsis jiangsuensis]MBB4685248.1 putative glyoxalase superfamily protein PhnB [Amycolatopsis jiangsuensis]
MTSQPTVWPAIRYDDAPAAIRFLVDVLGFEETLVVPGDETREVAHAELRWPEGGGMMLGSTGGDCDGIHDAMKPGTGAVYVVSDRVDEVYARVREAGGEITMALHDTDYGSHTFSLRDPERNSWTVGTYRGA